MKKLILISLCCICITACNRTGNRPQSVLTHADSTQSTVIGAVIMPDDSGKVYLNLVNGMITERIRKEQRQPVYLIFGSDEYTTLTANIQTEDSMANVRFSQILMPDGSGDGPFGRDISYRLDQQGTYSLSVMESLMAGDPWGGVFTLTLRLSR